LFTGTREEVGWWPNPSFPFEFKEVTEGRDLACGEIFLPWRPNPARANNNALATYILPQRSPPVVKTLAPPIFGVNPVKFRPLHDRAERPRSWLSRAAMKGAARD
jgi:hypothetical protein